MSFVQSQEKSMLGKVVEYVLYICAAIFPFTYFNSFLYWGTSTRSVLIILTVSLVGILYVVQLFKKREFVVIPRSPIFLALGIYFVSVCISGIFGLSFESTFWSAATRTTGLWYLFHLGLLIFFLANLFSDRVKMEKYIGIVVASTALFSFLSFLSLEGVGALFFTFVSDGFTFGNSTFAGMYIFGAFLLSLYYLFQKENRKWWMYIFPVAILLSPEIINPEIWFGDFSEGLLGEAKAATYVILASIFCFFCIWLVSKIKDVRTRSTVVYSIFGVMLLGAAFFTVSLFSADGYVRQLYLSQSTAARPLVWEMSGKAIQENPFFGWGGDTFERVYEMNYDNRLLQNEYGNEAWFDRAHNVFIDQAVDNGIIGLIVYIGGYITIILCLIYSALRSKEKNDRVLASVLIVYFALHLLELQTAFDTSISYFMVAIMVALAISVFHRTVTEVKGTEPAWVAPTGVRYSVAGILLIFFFWSLAWGLIPFVRAQLANGDIRRAGSSEKRLPLYETMFNSPVDKHAFLWRTVTDFQRGIGQNPDVLQKPEQVAGLKKEAALFSDLYEEYVETHPNHFRSYLNLADILIYQRLFGVDRLAEAQEILDEAIEIVPDSPQPYWMKAVAYVYMKEFKLAREYAQKGLELNPKIVMSQNIVQYVEKSIKAFPNIDLFFFRQI